MKLPRRDFLHLVAGAAAVPVASRLAWAETYPSRPVRITVGFPPGAATDIVGRLIAQTLSERLGQNFFVDNRPGAGSNLAADVVAKSAPDGYTLLAMTVTNTVNETLYTNLDFDFMHDLVPIARTIVSANVLVVNLSVPAKTVPEFIAYAKANPGKLNYASYGFGTAPNMAAELFKMMTGVDLVHVPYHIEFHARSVERAGPARVSAGSVDHRLHPIRQGARARGFPARRLPMRCPAFRRLRISFRATRRIFGTASPRRKGTPADIVDKLHDDINADPHRSGDKAKV